MKRRTFLVATTALIVPASTLALPPATRQAIERFTAGRASNEGRVTIDIAPLVENGNTVPITIRVASPMTMADHVQRIGLFTEANPQPDVAIFHLSPASGRAAVATRIRLAASQRIMTVAQMSDGSIWHQRVSVVVTLAACVEGAI